MGQYSDRVMDGAMVRDLSFVKCCGSDAEERRSCYRPIRNGRWVAHITRDMLQRFLGLS